MDKFKNKVALIIATKDRPEELSKLLTSLSRQSYYPDQIIVVDGSQPPLGDLIEKFSFMNIVSLRVFPPSGTKQRNAGILSVEKGISLVGFVDDDVVFEPESVERMMTYWESAPQSVGGASFNRVNHPALTGEWLKRSLLLEKLGLYNRKEGLVLSSGFQIMYGAAEKTTFIQWLGTTASVWRKEIFENFKFDEWFSGYSYLEDLDFSYRVGKVRRLAIVADAPYYHHPSPVGRPRDFIFGKKEVLNRFYFVRKHQELSVGKCCLTLVSRMILSFFLLFYERRMSYANRLLGNFAGFLESVKLTRKMAAY